MTLRFTLLLKYWLWSLGSIIISTPILAQCNVNDKYDKIISGYHSSIALKSTGVYAVWGSNMSNSGAADILSPQDINTTNYPTLNGTILKVALGGKSSNSQVDQAVLLTTTGLWAWGIEGNVVNTSLTSSAAFQRITSPTGANTYGLPTGVNPADVASLFATYQTLSILTTTGTVWILTQTSVAVEGSGGTAASAGSSTWKQVKINSTTNLTNVVEVRGQVSSATYNAFIALTSAGQVYTWGNSIYLGDTTASTNKVYATAMRLPAEFTSSAVPKMIGVTGGTTGTATTKNTYFLLSSTGKLYALGDNTQKQCGDFTVLERTSWVNAKINSTTNFTNINFFSVQEHTSSYPAVVAVTKSGDLYTWGANNSSMIGRTDNGTASGVLSATYDPGMPVIFSSGTDKAISAELGGHTLVYLKAGTSQFCYVGHRTNGSIGDGTSTSSSIGAYYASCTSTPSINICGSVPVAGSATNSTISSSSPSIVANGTSVCTITVQLKSAAGANLTASGGTVVITASSGTIGTVTDNNDGTYTATLTSSSSTGTATLGFSIIGTAGTHTTAVNFTNALPLSWINASASRQNNIVRIKWTTAHENSVRSFQVERSSNNYDWQVVATGIPASGNAIVTGDNNYQQIDSVFNPEKLSYRIRQEDIDGHYTYSPVLTVAAIYSTDKKISVFPVPIDNSFHLNNISSNNIKNVQLISISGHLIKSWNQYQSAYDIHDIPAGSYILRIETLNDIQTIKLVK